MSTEEQRVATLITAIEQLTPDVRRYRFDKPEGYTFAPGQATEVSLLRDGWADERRPFTFTSVPEDDYLDLTIKAYPDHDGVTEQLSTAEIGESLELGEPFGAIEDRGTGVFIAGGAGVTPFISILEARRRSGSLAGCHLVFSNRTEEDIILRHWFEAMPDLALTLVVTDEPTSSLATGRVDEAMLKELVEDFSQRFYVCGPPDMVDDVSGALERQGADSDGITLED